MTANAPVSETGIPRLMTIREVSEATRLSIDTLRWLRHCKQGPPSFRLGRRVVYRENDVLAWIESAWLRSSGASRAGEPRKHPHHTER